MKRPSQRLASPGNGMLFPKACEVSLISKSEVMLGKRVRRSLQQKQQQHWPPSGFWPAVFMPQVNQFAALARSPPA